MSQTEILSPQHPTPQARRQAAAAELHDARCGLIAAVRHLDGLEPEAFMLTQTALVALDDARLCLVSAAVSTMVRA